MAKNRPLTLDDPKEQRRIEAVWAAINGSIVTVGLHNTGVRYPEGKKPLVAQVAFWNHFGTRSIPARPFISQAIDVARPRLTRLQNKLLDDVVDGKKGLRKALKILGKRIELEIVKIIDTSNDWAVPNAPSTAAQKNRPGGAIRGATPLIKSGLLKRSITSVVRTTGGRLSVDPDPLQDV